MIQGIIVRTSDDARVVERAMQKIEANQCRRDRENGVNSAKRRRVCHKEEKSLNWTANRWKK